MFEEIEDESFSIREERILNFWKEKKIFELSLKQRENASLFSFYDGPPFATGLPHYGHLLAGTLKDVIPRYKTMKGFCVPRRFGWDCHGLPIENEIEKSLELSGAAEIEQFGIPKFNAECRKIVQRYTTEWKAVVERMGRWVDFSKTWKTMDPTFMETVWWVFKQVYDKGLIYEGMKVMPFSAKLGTPLSNFEATENYQEVDDPSLVVALKLKEEPTVSLLVWTTTPWTLISNRAATVGLEIGYVKVEVEGKFYILAESAVERWFKERAKIIERFEGKSLVGKEYQPLFDHFPDENAFRVIGGDFVSTEDGTGIVHTAPAFGEDDFYACQAAGIPLVCPVDKNGQFTDEVPEYLGQFVKDADKDIIRRIKEKGQLIYRGTIHHRYPFCWRSDTPLIYRAMTTWFMNVETIKEKLLASATKVHWTPSHLKEGRFGNWLEGARDWAISRNRYWGTPIPIWRNDEGDVHVVGSVKELEALTGEEITDLHRDKIDHLTFEKEGKVYRRVTEVFDCWFDTGSAPYAQNHYPFENKEATERAFPADFIAEGVDQTRTWFYTLMVLSVALFDEPAYKNVIANGILLAEDGKKMSKRLKNYPEPMKVVDEFGADAVRLYMLHSPAVKADDLRFSKRGVELCLRQILIPFWNSHAFFLTYARIYQWAPSGEFKQPSALIDRWILAKLEELIQTVEKGMDEYDLSSAVEPFVGFIDQLTNWYIRRSRRRFWADEETPDRQEAFATLYHVLTELCKVAAPFVPFLSEAIYLNLKSKQMPQSVHLCDYPTYHTSCRDPKLEKGMDALQVSVSLGHALRKEHKIKVRQPLAAVHVVCGDEEQFEFLKHQSHLIAEELNVKKVIFHDEKQAFVSLSVKPNFRVLGKKVGKHMKEAQLLISQLSQDQISQLFEKKALPIKLGGESFELLNEDIEITRVVHDGWIAINAGVITIALETELTEELELEGIARELVNKINLMRKQGGLAVTDRIDLELAASEKVKESLAIHGDFVKQEVLAVELRFGNPSNSTPWDINGEPTSIALQKI
ncbi:MAG: Isoleucine--tRNA ligase [Chlamydiales bacterium]|nr:Isoleucine--tRNA ligase [Chlamydiales bacterium]MCH9619114.1 Isoleucine--tRNA ligase [Chlamydiales bacterium]MCH9622376.1 Isoleucine--tRNA ligase [Chlamydiales bacterium]